MDPATPAAVNSAVNILLQSISDENRGMLETTRNLPMCRADAETQTGLLAHVDEYARAVKATLESVQRQLLVKMSALHTEHNKLIPFHRLPVELFARIISEALKPLQSLRWSRPTYTGRLAILCEVCKQWRDVINGTASLWASIDILDPTTITTAAVSRAAGHPLNIIAAPLSLISLADRLPDGLDEFTDTAMALSIRWRSLQIVVPSSEKALAVMNAPAPLLQSLELKALTKFRLPFKKGSILFQGTGPQLRRFGLHGVAIPWGSSLLRGLQYLSVSRLDELSPSCEEILGILRACPGLVELDLYLKLATTGRGRKKETLLTLTELRSLSLSLSTLCALTLLETIRLPSIQSVSLELDCSTDSDGLFTRIIKHTEALFPAVFNEQYALLIKLFGPTGLSWTCEPRRGLYGSGRKFEIKTRSQPVTKTLECLIETLLDRFPTQSIEIYFDCPRYWNFSSVLWVFDGVDCITSILASNCDIDPLFTYMSGSTTYDEWGFPELHGIIAYDCDYSPSHLLRMVEARYGLDEGVESDISDDERELPPPLKWITISHAPGEADEDILGRVKDIMGSDCFEFDEKVGR
ncbi:hypothetical protein FS837_012192 [Tulasnella sp. UAMH 9824]|nr:hypothetical protein FS837_012192 [Tulasnella sp. UAMH 9824]